MKAPAIALLLFVACLAQVTVAPLFPFFAAVPDFVLVSLVLIAFFVGPIEVMFGMPFAAICLGFAADRAPGLLILCYLPLLPLAFALEDGHLPLNRGLRLFATGAITGLWVRSLLALSAISQGATADISTLIWQVLIPGIFLDVALLAVAYVPFRLLGWRGGDMTLQRSSY